MTAITDAQEAVLRSWVGNAVDISDLQDRYDRLNNFDDTVLEELHHQLAVLVSDDTSLIVVDGITINKVENIRSLRQMIKDFTMGGGSGLEDTQTLGILISEIKRPSYR